MAKPARDGLTTYSHGLLKESRAIDVGSCELRSDQRGVARPQGDGCDIGALGYRTSTDGGEVEPGVGPTPGASVVYLPLATR